ncbi:MAG: PAS domain S-box protein [Bacillota bacterium]
MRSESKQRDPETLAEGPLQTTLGHRPYALRAVLDHIPAGVFMVDAPSGKPILSNRRAVEMLGRGISPEAVGAELNERYQAYRYGTDQLYPVEEMPILAGLRGQAKTVSDMEVRRPDGSRVLLEINGAPVYDARGEIVASVVSFQDITERKRAELQLQWHQEHLEQMVAERTASLAQANESLRREIVDRTEAERRLAHLNGVLRAIRNVNQVIAAEKEPAQLIQKVCETLAQARGYSGAWIALFDQNERISAVAEAGLGDTFTHLRKSVEAGQLPVCCQIALRQRRLVASADIHCPCDECPGPLRRNLAAWLASPLCRGDKTFGILVAVVPAEVVRDEEERTLFAELAADIGLALANAELESGRHRMEQSLRESEQRFRAIFEQAGVGVAELESRTGRFVHVNQRFCDIVGYTREEMLQLGFQEITFPADLQLDLDSVARLLAGEIRDFTIEKRYRRKDGAVVWVNTTISPMWAAGEDPWHHIVVIEDITERKEAETKLREREATLQAVIRNIPVDFWARDQREVCFLQNETSCRNWGSMLGTTPEMQDIPDETFQLWKSNNRRAYSGEVVSEEVELTDKSGKHSYYRNIVAPIKEGDEVLGIVGVNIDLTQIKLAEAALRESEERYRLIVETANEGIFMLDVDYRIILANPKMAATLGYKIEEMLGRPVVGFMHPDDLADHRQQIAQRRRNVPGRYERRFLHKDGSVRWVLVSATPILNHAGEFTGSFAMFTDITDRKKAEQDLRDSEARFRSLVEQASDAFYLSSMDGRLLSVNRQACESLGYSRQELLAMNLSDIDVNYRADPDRLRVFRQGMIPGQPVSIESVYRRKDGSVFPVEVHAGLLEVAGKRMVLGLARDITERKRLQEMMIQSEKMLTVGGLAAGVAHEINNPLAGILQNAQVVLTRTSLDLPANRLAAERCGTTIEKVRAYMEDRRILEMLDFIRVSGERAAKIVRNMLAFSRTGTRTAKCPHDLRKLMDRTIELARSDYDLKKKHDFREIEMVREYAPDVPDVLVDDTEIQQVFFNLLKNAAQALGERPDVAKPPRIVVRIAHRENAVRVEVEDNGPGIPEAVRWRIFEPFFTTKEPGAGTGLGLSVSYFIITNDHGGTISVESVPGKGAKFIVTLPVEERTSRGASRPDCR